MGKIEKVRKRFSEFNIDGFMISNPWNRKYISGFTGSNGVVIISETKTILITDYRYYEQAKQQTEFDVILHKEHTGHKDRIYDEVAKQVNLMGIKRLGFEQQHLTFGFYSKLDILVEAEMISTYEVVEDIRMHKTKDEIEKLKIASEITDNAYLHILEFIHPGMKELDIAEELGRFIKENGGTTGGFPPIVASGIRSSFPHGRASEKILEKGDMVTIDFGANYQGYWSDISRTVALGEPSSILREIQGVVLTSFENCVKEIKAGLSDQEVDQLMSQYLISTGYIGNAGTGKGHGIGIEVHEKPLFSVVKEKVLKTGMVVTIEPGIYLRNVGGARVEDVLLITENGCEVLTPSTKELVIV